MTWNNEHEKRMEELWERLDELDAELDATGLDDALDWDKFPEMERVLDALVWNRAERWADRSARWAEMAEVAHESAMAELAAFGSVWPEDGVSQAEYDEMLEEFWEFACDLYEVGETWNERLVLTELY